MRDVVIVYDDAPAGEHAIRTLHEVARHLGERVKLRPLLWRFDLLADPDWRSEAAADAAGAGLMVVSASGNLPRAGLDWIRETLQQQPGGPGALVALLDGEDDPAGSASPRLKLLKGAAEAAGVQFFAPSLPLQTSLSAPAETSRTAGPPTSLSVRATARILLVEDDCFIRQLSAKVLCGAGYQVDTVESSQAAWESLQAGNYSLLITDNQMPGLTGLELVRKLRSAQLALPVIMASGGIEAEAFTQNQSLQPAMALPKPFTGKQLLETVAEALRRAGQDPAHTEVSFPAYGDAYNHWGLNE
jgi:CheY-like chemotaxis protein